MNKALYLLAIFLLAAPLSMAVADDGDWYVSGMPVFTDDDPDRRLDDGVGGGQVNVGYELNRQLFLEGHLGYHQLDGWPQWNLTGGAVQVRETLDFLDIGFNVVSNLNPDGAFNPFLIGGIGYLGTSTSITDAEENRPSFTFGFGFTWRISDSRWSVRNEYRARFAYEEDLTYTDYLYSLGLQYSFGKRRAVPVPINDTDNDGVLDDIDQCPYSEPGETVGPDGCVVFIDSDRDGVVDNKDLCANTPSGAPVDAYGCISDVDGDGVTDDIDECPNTVQGAAIYVNGCERDDDGDNVVNHRDECPNSRPGAPVDARGCEIGSTYELRGVNFATGSDRLLTGAEQILDDAAQWLLDHPHLIVEVAGHTDSDGSAAANLSLSDRRANTVRDYLIARGVNPNSISARGYGESQPIADNETAEGKAENRRVELRILGSQ